MRILGFVSASMLAATVRSLLRFFGLEVSRIHSAKGVNLEAHSGLVCPFVVQCLCPEYPGFSFLMAF